MPTAPNWSAHCPHTGSPFGPLYVWEICINYCTTNSITSFNPGLRLLCLIWMVWQIWWFGITSQYYKSFRKNQVKFLQLWVSTIFNDQCGKNVLFHIA
jgi:hypothetical protein